MDELFLYYANLLIVQYNDKPKAQATINLFTYLIFVNLIFQQIQNAFDWKKAKGQQLDIIGKWVGVSRDYLASTYWGKKYFAYPKSNQLVPDDETDNLQHGYSDYSTFETDTGNVLTYKDLSFVEQQLDDDDYRIVIGLKIIKNSINHTCKNIDDAIAYYFAEKDSDGNVILNPDGTIYNIRVYTTWDAHEITYHYPADMTVIMEVCNYKNVLPAPTGVSIVLREI